MAIKLIRLIFIVACALLGGTWAYYIAPSVYGANLPSREIVLWTVVGGVIGGALAVAVLFGLRVITQERFERLSPAVLAIALALVVGFTLGRWIIDMYFEELDPVIQTLLICSLVLVFGYIGISLGLTRASNWETLVKAVHKQSFGTTSIPKVVDTSVIIDGRIADICQTGFIEGDLIVPRFVLKELQNIADSSDVLRRARGRRGLDILRELQGPDSKVTVRVVEDDPKEIREVDGKLVKLAQQFNAKVMTNDLNLNKVAQIDGVEVLNINDLANALKPAVLPDEHMEVKIVKEGKEALQGVGYLDDGTMVVVDGGRDHVGKDVSVIVTSVLQTSAGRMIFSKLQGVLS